VQSQLWPRHFPYRSPTYDANGNATSRQGSSIAWSSYNYPITASAGSGSTAETVGFAYGPDRSRWQQSYTGNGTTETTDYIGGLLDLVTSGGVNDYRHYIYAAGEPVAVYSRKSSGVNTFSYFLSDHQGSVADITNSSGGIDVEESFTPFGNRRNPTTWSGAASNSDLTTAAGITRAGYTFQTQLGLWMGMNHMNGRVQDAITGRFLSEDPHGIVPRNTQSFNRYSYVANNPLTLMDPTGFTSTPSGPPITNVNQQVVIPPPPQSGTQPAPNVPYDTSTAVPCNSMGDCVPVTPAGACAIGTSTTLQQDCANNANLDAITAEIQAYLAGQRTPPAGDGSTQDPTPCALAIFACLDALGAAQLPTSVIILNPGGTQDPDHPLESNRPVLAAYPGVD